MHVKVWLVWVDFLRLEQTWTDMSLTWFFSSFWQSLIACFGAFNVLLCYIDSFILPPANIHIVKEFCSTWSNGLWFLSRLSFMSSSSINISSCGTAKKCQGWDWMHCSPSQSLLTGANSSVESIKWERAAPLRQDFRGIFSFPPWVTCRTAKTVKELLFFNPLIVQLQSSFLAFELRSSGIESWPD